MRKKSLLCSLAVAQVRFTSVPFGSASSASHSTGSSTQSSRLDGLVFHERENVRPFIVKLSM
jgi:hypothetical protein